MTFKDKRNLENILVQSLVDLDYDKVQYVLDRCLTTTIYKSVVLNFCRMYAASDTRMVDLVINWIRSTPGRPHIMMGPMLPAYRRDFQPYCSIVGGVGFDYFPTLDLVTLDVHKQILERLPHPCLFENTWCRKWRGRITLEQVHFYETLVSKSRLHRFLRSNVVNLDIEALKNAYERGCVSEKAMENLMRESCGQVHLPYDLKRQDAYALLEWWTSVGEHNYWNTMVRFAHHYKIHSLIPLPPSGCRAYSGDLMICYAAKHGDLRWLDYMWMAFSFSYGTRILVNIASFDEHVFFDKLCDHLKTFEESVSKGDMLFVERLRWFKAHRRDDDVLADCTFLSVVAHVFPKEIVHLSLKFPHKVKRRVLVRNRWMLDLYARAPVDKAYDERCSDLDVRDMCDLVVMARAECLAVSNSLAPVDGAFQDIAPLVCDFLLSQSKR